MGNTKSKTPGQWARHERLQENNIRYFERVQNRNRVTEPQKRKPEPKQIQSHINKNDEQSDHGSHVGNTIDEMALASPTNVRNRTALLEMAESSPHSSLSPRNSSLIPTTPVGPLAQGTSLSMPKVRGKSLPKTSSAQRTKTKNTNMKHSRSSPTISRSGNPQSDSFKGHLLLPLSSRDRKSTGDIYAMEKSPFDEHDDDENASNNSIVSGVPLEDPTSFDEMLSSGMVWAEFPRGGKISCVAFSPPERSMPEISTQRNPLLMAVGSDDGFVTLVEILDDVNNASSECLKDILKQKQNQRKFGAIRELPREGKIRCVDLSSNGKYLAVGGDDCTCAIVDIAGEEITALEGNNAEAIFQNSKKLLPPLQVLCEIEREDRVYSTRFSPCSSMIAIGGFDGMVAVAHIITDDISDDIDIVMITEIPRLGLVLDIDWTSDGSLVAIGGSDKMAAVISVYDNRNQSASDANDNSMTSNTVRSTVGSWEVAGEVHRSSSVQCVKWSPDCSRLAVGGHDGTVAIVDITTRKILREIKRRKRKGQGYKIKNLCWSPDGKFLAIANTTSCVIMEMKTFMVVHEVTRRGNVNCVDWSYQLPSRVAVGGRYLAIGCDNRTVAIVKTGSDDDGVSHCSSSYLRNEQDDCSSINSSFSWVLEEGSFRDIDEDRRMMEKNATYNCVKIKINCVVFSPNDNPCERSEIMVIATSDGRVRIISTIDFTLLKELDFSWPINDIQFSSDGSYLVIAGESQSFYVLSMERWNIVQELQLPASTLCMGFSVYNDLLCLGLSDGILAFVHCMYHGLWEVFGEMDESNSPILALSWSSCGEFLAVGRSDSTVSIHEYHSIRDNFYVPKLELRRKTESAVHALSFGVGGKYLAIGGACWNVSIHSCKGDWPVIRQLKMGGWVMSLKWSPDNRFLGIGGNEKSMGISVYDTLSWARVDELEALDNGEGSTILEWSLDGRFFVAAGGAECKVIDVATWKVSHLIDEFGKEKYENSTFQTSETTIDFSDPLANNKPPQNPSMSSSSSSSSSQNNNETHHHHHHPLDNKNQAFPSEYRVFSQFEQTCQKISLFYNEQNPPDFILGFISCLGNLYEHIQWFKSCKAEVYMSLTKRDDGQLLLSVLEVITRATRLMEYILTTNDSDASRWWQNTEKFELTARRKRRIKEWNDLCTRQCGSGPPIIDIELLRSS